MNKKTNYRYRPSYHKLPENLWEDSLLVGRSDEMSIMSIDRYFGPRAPQRPRAHKFWEMGCVVRGTPEFLYGEGKTVLLKSDSIFMIPPGILHVEKCDEPADIIWLSFLGTRLDKEILSEPAFVKDHELARMVEYLWIFTEIEEQGIGQELDGKASEIVARFFRIYKFAGHPVSDMVERSIAYMHSHMFEQITIPELADNMGCCQTYFRRLFKMRTGRSPVEYLQELRMRHAAALLEHTKMSIEEISRTVGYDDPFYFSRVFKKRFQLSPSQFRKIL